MTESSDAQLQAMIDNMSEKTGRSLAEWMQLLAAAGLEKHGEILKLLKGDYGVTHGYANTIANLYRQQSAGGPPAEADLLTAQYAGGKAGLRPIHEAILAAVTSFGGDVEIAPKKTYVSLRRNKQFAIVQPSTRTRVDLGLNLKGVDGTERLEGGNAFGGMCTHLVRLFTTSDVDEEVLDWLRRAYDQS